jgi:hypothetical protein
MFCLNFLNECEFKNMQASCRDVACRKEGHEMLSRKVVTRSGRGFRGYFPSKKLNRSVQFESLLERDAIRLFESSKEIVTYKEQPTIIYYYLDDIQKRYHPDFELVLQDGYIFHVEVKPSIHLTTITLSAKYQAIAQSYYSRTESFVVLTEKELRAAINMDFYQLINNSNVKELT